MTVAIVTCTDTHPLIGGGPCNGDHRENLHHNDAGFFWGPIEQESLMPETITLDAARTLMGGKVPTTPPYPAAWWLTTDAFLLERFDKWKADYTVAVDNIGALAATIGLKYTDAYFVTHSEVTTVTGFGVPAGMRLPAEHPDAVPVPVGWTIDKKSDRLRPSRRTKADRASSLTAQFEAISDVPNVRAYMHGLPLALFLEDRGLGGGTMYGVSYRRGENCVWAYCFGDPDRAAKDEKFPVDARLWTRMPLSYLITMVEENAARLAVDNADNGG